MPLHGELQRYAGDKAFLSEMPFGQVLHDRNEKGVHNDGGGQGAEASQDRAEPCEEEAAVRRVEGSKDETRNRRGLQLRQRHFGVGGFGEIGGLDDIVRRILLGIGEEVRRSERERPVGGGASESGYSGERTESVESAGEPGNSRLEDPRDAGRFYPQSGMEPRAKRQENIAGEDELYKGSLATYIEKFAIYGI